ncbi:MAG: FAD-dependent oxidoreductase [Thermodesulfobacteriota bacterium]|jgi:flavocytochrome c
MKRKRRDGITRRQFLKNTGVGAGIMALGQVGLAESAQLPKGISKEKHDVVVIGTGLSGLLAALEARMNGADVVILEKTNMNHSGGSSKLAAGMIAIPSDNTKQAKDDYYEDFIKKSMGKADPDLTRVLADQVFDGVDWLKTQGIEFMPPIPIPGFRVKAIVAVPSLFKGMPKALERLREVLEKQGGKITYETKAKELIMDSRGKVVGVKAIDNAGVKDYISKAVIIASGGFSANKEMLQLWVDPDADAMMARGVPWSTGDGIKMAHKAGALLVNMGGMTGLHIAAVSPKNTAAGNPFIVLPFCIAVNREGKRYMDESKGYVAHGKAVMKQPGQKVALVFDEEIKKTPAGTATVKLFQGLGIEVIDAETIEGLASKIGAPPAALKLTVDEFNNAVKDGKALGIKPPKEALANKIITPKFYAFYPLVPGITLTFGGVKVNTNAQVLEPDGRIIPGLYSAGECVGGIFYDDYISGGSLARCVVLGRIAGKNAASEKVIKKKTS